MGNQGTREVRRMSEKKLIDIHKVSVERFYDGINRVWRATRVVFETNYGSIVHRPFTQREITQEIDGKKVVLTNKQSVKVDELNPVILELSNRVSEEGGCRVQGNFRTFSKNGKTYRYFSADEIKQIGEGLSLEKLETQKVLGEE